MTTPQPVPLVDQCNTLLAQIPAQLHTGMLTTSAGKAGVLTFRTSSATLTVFLTADDLRQWSSILTGLADQMTGGVVPATAADVAVLNNAPGLTKRSKRARLHWL